MYCDRCGTPIHVGQRFCAACGAPLVLPRVQATGDRRQATEESFFDTLLGHSAREVLAPYGLTSLEEARLYLLPDQYDDVLRRAQGLAAARAHADAMPPLPSSAVRLPS